MTEPMQNVNLIKLTKLERKVLQSFKTQPKDEEYPEGHNLEEIATVVFGKDVLNVERRGGHYCTGISICYAAKSSLSRTLKQLHQKGLVKKCIPVYNRGWIKREDVDGSPICFYGTKDKALKVTSKNDSGLWVVEWLSFRYLPSGCHVWWMLTDKAKGLVP